MDMKRACQTLYDNVPFLVLIPKGNRPGVVLIWNSPSWLLRPYIHFSVQGKTSFGKLTKVSSLHCLYSRIPFATQLDDVEYARYPLCGREMEPLSRRRWYCPLTASNPPGRGVRYHANEENRPKNPTSRGLIPLAGPTAPSGKGPRKEWKQPAPNRHYRLVRHRHFENVGGVIAGRKDLTAQPLQANVN